MKDFFIPLVIALISGVTFLAYKHTIGYSKAYPWFLGIIFFVFITLTSYNAGVDSASFSVLENNLFEVEQRSEVIKIIKEKRFSSDPFIISVWILSFLYLFFLRAILPELTNKQKEK